MRKYLIASDLDGTLVFNTQDPLNHLAVRRFNTAMQRLKGKKILAYVTGRHLELARAGMQKAGLIRPDVLICDVGTSMYVYRNGAWKQDTVFQKKLLDAWRGRRAKDIARYLKNIPELKPQEAAKQKEFKQSYYVKLQHSPRILIRKIRSLLPSGIGTQIIYSIDREKSVGLLDIVPKSSGKEKALEFLAKQHGIPRSNIVYAGDSGNDMSVFTSGIRSIVTKNAGPEVKGIDAYRAERPFALGVIEGLEAYGLLPKEKKGIYVQMHSIHGLFRSKNPELGRDEDTGGQIAYVLDLAKALGKRPEIGQVDIMTRLIRDSRYPGYDTKIERISKKVRLVRIPCGPDKYIKKVHLWPHLDQYIENVKKFMDAEDIIPDILHSNYADAGLVCARLSKELGAPQVHTGHSLGKSKMRRLGITTSNFEKYDRVYKFSKRLPAEQEAIDNASAIIVSSEQEKGIQYRGYKTDPKKFILVEPGIDLEKFISYTDKRAKKGIKFNFSKPVILCLSRIDARKNIRGLLRAFLSDHKLVKQAQLVISSSSLFNRKTLGKEERALLRAIERDIRSHHAEESVLLLPVQLAYTDNLYRAAARSRGVFANVAFVEPFGLTLLEAGASGLPGVVTKNGGAVTIIQHCKNGLLTDPASSQDIARSLKKILFDKKIWKEFSISGVKNIPKIYSWKKAAEKESHLFDRLLAGRSR